MSPPLSPRRKSNYNANPNSRPSSSSTVTYIPTGGTTVLASPASTNAIYIPTTIFTLEEFAKPTRIGYWNRRGDTISPSGRLVAAAVHNVYPWDLRHYPEHALMNEIGVLSLPATTLERVAFWQAGL